MGLAGERRQRWQLLPVGQAAAQHSQAGAILPCSVHVFMLLHALGVSSRHINDVAGCFGKDGGQQGLLICAGRRQAVVIGLSSIKGFGRRAARQKQLPFFLVLGETMKEKSNPGPLVQSITSQLSSHPGLTFITKNSIIRNNKCLTANYTCQNSFPASP